MKPFSTKSITYVSYFPAEKQISGKKVTILKEAEIHAQAEIKSFSPIVFKLPAAATKKIEAIIAKEAKKILTGS